MQNQYKTPVETWSVFKKIFLWYLRVTIVFLCFIMNIFYFSVIFRRISFIIKSVVSLIIRSMCRNVRVFLSIMLLHLFFFQQQMLALCLFAFLRRAISLFAMGIIIVIGYPHRHTGGAIRIAGGVRLLKLKSTEGGGSTTSRNYFRPLKLKSAEAQPPQELW